MGSFRPTARPCDQGETANDTQQCVAESNRTHKEEVKKEKHRDGIVEKAFSSLAVHLPRSLRGIILSQ